MEAACERELHWFLCKVESTAEIIEVAHVYPREVVDGSELALEHRPVLVRQVSVNKDDVLSLHCRSHLPQHRHQIDRQTEVQSDASHKTAEHDCDDGHGDEVVVAEVVHDRQHHGVLEEVCVHEEGRQETGDRSDGQHLEVDRESVVFGEVDQAETGGREESGLDAEDEGVGRVEGALGAGLASQTPAEEGHCADCDDCALGDLGEGEVTIW